MNAPEINKRIGQLIRLHRKHAGLTQEQLAERVGTSFSYVGALERGERNVTIQTLDKIAKALETNFFMLLQPAILDDESNEPLTAIQILLQAQEVRDQRRVLHMLKEMFRPDP
ncbi:helix-turn-helix domain-containing protein [Paenibacillus sp. S150]|uniref:helix-turn-helix domain-containing protein n=1 Tax=Paenibacillus sp. S150 TaxID=2749826 RepID=UPI001C5A3B8B|nr:helix-turn-helix transcriptional regulator [Paenibacillus sp. S150]MBW4079919.1 helix-turn-helix transcriptional regulator [Paenibacillus sp. S150]